MRLFTGISIAPHVLDKLDQALAELRPVARLQWSPLQNLHITSKFIGESAENALPELESALAAVEPPGKLRIAIAQFGFFPNPHHPRVFFAGVNGGPGLAELARKIDEALEPLGCAREERPYSPHLTLARIRSARDIRRLREVIASMSDFDFGSFDATDFGLYSSKPGRGGSVYTRLASYPLMKAMSSSL